MELSYSEIGDDQESMQSSTIPDPYGKVTRTPSCSTKGCAILNTNETFTGENTKHKETQYAKSQSFPSR